MARQLAGVKDWSGRGKRLYAHFMSSTRSRFHPVATPQTKQPAPAKPSAPDRDAAKADNVTVPAKLDPRAATKDLPPERGGYDGPEPTRYGDWEHKGRATDF